MTTLTLRYYQNDAVNSLSKQIIKNPHSKCVGIVPCGGGKTLIISALTDRFNERQILIITPRRKLLLQNAKTLPMAGICSGTYGCDTGDKHKIILSTFQTLLSRKEQIKTPELIIIDECHLVGDDEETSQYAKFLNKYKDVPVIGLTATPIRGNTSLFELKGFKWHKSYEIDMMTLIREGYLKPIRAIGIKSEINPEISFEQIPELTKRAVKNAYETIKKNNRIRNLYFARDINHAKLISNELLLLGVEPCNVLLVHSNKCDSENEESFKEFNKVDARVKHMVNVSMVSIGVDLMIDSIIMLRHISSFGHFYQCIGRGMRVNKEINKVDCILLDYGSNIESYKKLTYQSIRDGIRTGNFPLKKCPECETLLTPMTLKCSNCGFVFRFKTTLTEYSRYGDLLTSKIRFGQIISAKNEIEGELFKGVYELDSGDFVIRYTTDGKLIKNGAHCTYELTARGNLMLSNN